MQPYKIILIPYVNIMILFIHMHTPRRHHIPGSPQLHRRLTFNVNFRFQRMKPVRNHPHAKSHNSLLLRNCPCNCLSFYHAKPFRVNDYGFVARGVDTQNPAPSPTSGSKLIISVFEILKLFLFLSDSISFFICLVHTFSTPCSFIL